MTNDRYTVEELQQLLRMAQQREAKAAPELKPVGVGSLVKYIDKAGHEHTALVLEVKPGGVLQLRVLRTAQPNVDMEVGPGRWKR